MQYIVEFEGSAHIQADDEEQAEFFIIEDLSALGENFIYEITGVKSVNNVD